MSAPDIGHGSDDEVYPLARLLIDGVDMLAAHGRWGHRPWPAELILTDNFLLLPAEPSRRVVVYGEWPDPGGLAPKITSDGDVVVWSDFHEVYETGDDPLDFSHAYDWSPVDVPDLVFDAQQYTAEVHRATAAREWKSDSWQAALLLEAYLVGEPQDPGDRLTPGDEWEVGFAEPDRDHAHRYRVTYWTEDQRTIATVSLTAEPGTPEQQARAMYEYLLATPADHWPATRHVRPDG
jgi:hypothetical protein